MGMQQLHLPIIIIVAILVFIFAKKGIDLWAAAFISVLILYSLSYSSASYWAGNYSKAKGKDADEHDH